MKGESDGKESANDDLDGESNSMEIEDLIQHMMVDIKIRLTITETIMELKTTMMILIASIFIIVIKRAHYQTLQM